MLKYALAASRYIYFRFANNLKVFWFSYAVCLFVALCIFGITVKAEGSKELNPDGGDRAYLYSSTELGYGGANPYPTQGLVRVYVNAGEVIYVGSSAQGTGNGKIYLRSPNGSLYSTTASTTIGRINNRTEEMAGPKHGIAPEANPSGFTAATFSVAAGQGGIWEVYFIGPSNRVGVSGFLTYFSESRSQDFNNSSTTAANRQSATNGYIAAFDVSVRSNGLLAGQFIPGRAYMNVLGAGLGDYNRRFTGALQVLTKDGYQYEVKANGLAGHIFVFFANNKGYRTATGAPTYKSQNNTSVTNLQNPLNEDTPTDVTHKLFFNTPASDLPLKAPIRTSNGLYSATPGTLTETWLVNPTVVPTANNFTIRGIEGTPDLIGTNPLGGYIGFESNQKGSFTITIDVNNNGPDAADVILTDLADVGYNEKYWNGLNGLGVPITGSLVLQPGQIKVNLKNGEVHFPFIDVENNPGGISITRTNGNVGIGDKTVYWDDSAITFANGSTTPNPVTTTSSGINSTTNGHKWGSTSYRTNDFGEGKGIDTWTYVESAPLSSQNPIQLREANLQVLSVTPLKSIFCMGEDEGFKVTVKNNGPSDVINSKFKFAFPAEFSDVNVLSTVSGTAIVNSGSVSGNEYNASLNVSNGSSVTFTITGTVAAMSSAYLLNVEASIMRPADVTDPDATNNDSAPPTNAKIECDSDPSGIGCNNIVPLNSTQVQKVPVPVVSIIN